MTLTTAVWISLVAAAGTTAVRALRARAVTVPVRATVPRPGADVEDWHPRVTSGCGR
jgi:hypothetical protein